MDYEKFYTSAKWKKARSKVLRRDNYIDQYAKRYGRICEATIVHHLIPLEFAPELAYSLNNLVAVSLASHNKLHNRDTNQLNQEGYNFAMIVLNKRRALELVERLKEYPPIL